MKSLQKEMLYINMMICCSSVAVVLFNHQVQNTSVLELALQLLIFISLYELVRCHFCP